jgi:hypothetical protein
MSSPLVPNPDPRLAGTRTVTVDPLWAEALLLGAWTQSEDPIARMCALNS